MWPVSYTYDADGNLVSEIGKDGMDKVELTYTYTVENRLGAVYDRKELLMAAAYDRDGNSSSSGKNGNCNGNINGNSSTNNRKGWRQRWYCGA